MFASRRGLIALTVGVLSLLAVGRMVEARPAGMDAAQDLAAHIVSEEIPVSTEDVIQHEPAVAYNWKHHEYLAVWRDEPNGDIYAQRVSDQGTRVGAIPIPLASGTQDHREPAVAYDPILDRYLVVWMTWDGSYWEIHGRFVPWEGPSPSLTEFTIRDSTTNDAWHPQVAYARGQTPKQEFLVVWAQKPGTTSGSDIKGQRLYADGSGLAGSLLTLASQPELCDYPDVAYNRHNNEYLVVWDVGDDPLTTGINIEGVRLNGSGGTLGSGIFGIAGWPDDEQYPAVAACSDADQYLVAWESVVGTNNHDIYTRFIAGDGTLGSVHAMDNTTIQQRYPDVACAMAEDRYLVTWEEQYSNAAGPYGIWGQWAIPDETIGESFGIAAPNTATELNHLNPAVAGGYANFMVVWEQERYGSAYQDIYGRLISPHGVYLPLVVKG